MAENKTKATEASVEAYLSVIEEDGRRKDCDSIAALMCRITKAQPKMWGSSIVGFDSYHYRYDSGRQGDFAVIGLSSRKGDISVYLLAPDSKG